MSDYQIKDRGLKSDTETTSAVSAISYEVENGLYSGLDTSKIKDQIIKLQTKNKFPANLEYVDSFYDKKTSLSGVAFKDKFTGKVTIGFAGTNLDNGIIESSKDLLVDVSIAAKGEAPSNAYFKEGHVFMKKITSKYQVETVTGHSKGGRDGAVLGMAYKIPNVILYNAAPIRNLTGQMVGSSSVRNLFFKGMSNLELNALVDSYDGQLIYFVSENDFLTKAAKVRGSLYPGTIHVIKNGKPHAITGFLTKDEQDFIRKYTPALNELFHKQAAIHASTEKRLSDLGALRKKFASNGGGVSASEEMYLDAAEALALTKGMKATIQLEIADLKNLYDNAMEEAKMLWNATQRSAYAVGSSLSHAEVMSALMSGGATEAIIQTIPVNEYKASLTKLNGIEQDYTALISQISRAIEQQVRVDSQLAQQIG